MMDTALFMSRPEKSQPWFTLPLLALALLAMLLAAPARAERSMQARFITNANGDIALIGNAILTCPAGGGCAAGLAGGSDRNDNYSMVYIDIDSDSSTFSSSSANLSIPSGSTVLFAGLYWSGITADVARGQVLFKTPISFGYSQLNASVLDVSPFRTDSYQGYANITAQVAAAGNGTYTVANVLTTPGTGNYGAWGMVVVYQNNSVALRNLAVYDSFMQLAGTSATIPVSGFLTPLSGPVSTRLGAITYEGDLPATGDTFSINGTQLTDACNPTNNFYNATICDLGTNVTSRNPASVNNMVFDIDRINVPAGVVGNGATSATIQVSSPSTSETFLLGVVTFATDLYVPIITPNIVKTATDLNGGALVAGDILRWNISLSNTGQDSATNLVLTDPIPANLTYSPNSLRITSGANAGVKTDASGDDQADYIASGTPRVVFRLGSGANGSNGGTLAYNQSTAISFDTVVNSGLVAGTPITNTANISYSGQTIPDQFAGSGAAASTVVLVPPTIVKSFSPGVIDVGAAAELRFVVSNAAANPASITGAAFLDTYPAGMVNAATPNAQVVCTPGASATLVGGTAGGNTLGISNGTIPPNGNCTISVNVTATGVGNYTNTSSAITTTNAGTGTTASATLSVGKPAIAKAFSPTTILSGGTTTLTFTLSNLATTALTGVAFSDPLTGMAVAATPGVTNTCGGVVSAPASGTTISLSGGTLPARVGGVNGSCTISVNITSSTTGVLNNTATGVSSTQSGAAGNPSNTASLTVIGAPVLSKSFSPTSVRTNVPVQMTITVANPNTTTTITGVAFTDTYPAGLRNNTPASPTLNCTGGSTATPTGGINGGNTLGISGGSLVPGGSCTVTVNVEGTTTGNKVNSTGTVTSANGGTGAAASATLDITSLIAPTVTKAFGAATIIAGNTTTLTITLSNGNNSAITGVAFSDNYPANLFNDSTPGIVNTCGGTVTGTAGGTSLVLTGGTIPARPGGAGTFGTCTVTITVTSSETAEYTNTTGTITTANAGTFGPDTAILNVLAPPQISKSFSPTTIAVGGGGGSSAYSTLTLELSNPTTSTVSLTGVAVTDVFPANLVMRNSPAANNLCGGTLEGRTGGAWGAVAGGDTELRVTGVTLAPNASCTVTVRVRSATAGIYTNTTNAVTSTNGGTGITASAVLTIGQPGLAKSFGTSPIAVGATSVLTLTLSNPTGTAMTLADFTDTYPAGMTNTGTPAGATTCAGGTVTAAANGGSVALSGGTIPATGSCTVTVNVTATGTATNTVPAGGLTVSGGGSNGGAASAQLQVYLKPTVTKSFSPTSVSVSGTSRLSIGLTNANSVNGTTTAFTDIFPTNMVVAATPSATNTCAGTLQGRTGAGAWGGIVAGNTSVRLTGGTILANSSCLIEVNITSATAGSYTNSTGTVTTANIGSGDADSATLIVMAAPTVAKSFSPSSVVTNEVSVLTITLTNSNAADVIGATFTDTYPAGLVNDATPNITTSCTGGTLAGSAGGNSVGLSGATVPANSSCTVTVRVKSATAGSYINSTGAVTTTNTDAGAAASATLSVSNLMPVLNLLKLVSVYSDPYNVSFPKSVPGAISAYTIRLTNTGPGTVDNNTVVISDPLPADVDLYVGDIGGGGSGPVVFTNGSPVSGLSWTFTSIGSTTDSVDFSVNGSDWTYNPGLTADGAGFNSAVRYIRFKPNGSMNAAGGSNPYAEFSFRVRIR